MLNISEHFYKPLICFSVSDTQIFKSIIYRLEFQFKLDLGKIRGEHVFSNHKWVLKL